MNPRRHVWLGVATVLVVVGTFVSVWAAHELARNDAQISRQAFVASSTEIASTLKLAIQHEQDLAVSAGAFFADNPDASQPEFSQWTSSVRAFQRYPELETIAEVTIVPASQLSAFAAR